MCIKSLLLLSFVLILVLTEIKCRNNPKIKLNCWPTKLKYKSFAINITLSTRNKKDQLINSGFIFSPKELDFEPKRKTVVIVHGLAVFNEHRRQVKDLRDSLLEWADVNVLAVNWEKGCSNPMLYFQAVLNTKFTAFTIKDFLSETMRLWREENELEDNWTPELHLVGFSLGAHVCGQVAKLLRDEDNLLVDRVTGLDPAGPCFEPVDFPLRLARTNARFVDVIHTDGAISQNEAFGLFDSIGDVDFYVNGGRKQPGCKLIITKRSVQSLIKLLVHAVKNGVCSHRRGFAIFIASVKQAVSNDCRFGAYPWRIGTPFNSTIEQTYEALPEMGINADLYNYNTSTYYVPTTSKEPYCEIASNS